MGGFCVLRFAFCVLRFAFGVWRLAFGVWRFAFCVLRGLHFGSRLLDAVGVADAWVSSLMLRCRGRPGGRLLLFASPKRSKQEKGDRRPLPFGFP